MPKTSVWDQNVKKTGEVDLPAAIFGAKISQPLLAQAVRVYLNNQRRARAKVKHRGEVVGSRKKIWRQKGTGRARHGDRYAPIFVGGGRAHGPTGEENYQLKMSKKMKRQALFGALSYQLAQKQVAVVSGLEKVPPKTQKMAKVLDGLRSKAFDAPAKRLTLILPEKIESVERGARNLAGIQLALAGELNPYLVLNAGQLLFLKDSLPVLDEVFLGKPAKKR